MVLTNQEGINCLSRKQVKRMWDINLYPLFQYIGCSTLEKQLAQQGFRGVTTKVLSYSKHTLLCLCEHKKSVSKWIEESAIISVSNASFPDAQTAQKKNGNEV